MLMGTDTDYPSASNTVTMSMTSTFHIYRDNRYREIKSPGHSIQIHQCISVRQVLSRNRNTCNRCSNSSKMSRSKPPNIPGSTGTNPSGQPHTGKPYTLTSYLTSSPQSFSLSTSGCIVVGPHNHFGSCSRLNVCYCRCLR